MNLSTSGTLDQHGTDGRAWRRLTAAGGLELRGRRTRTGIVRSVTPTDWPWYRRWAGTRAGCMASAQIWLQLAPAPGTPVTWALYSPTHRVAPPRPSSWPMALVYASRLVTRVKIYLAFGPASGLPGRAVIRRGGEEEVLIPAGTVGELGSIPHKPLDGQDIGDPKRTASKATERIDPAGNAQQGHPLAGGPIVSVAIRFQTVVTPDPVIKVCTALGRGARVVVPQPPASDRRSIRRDQLLRAVL